MSGGSAIVATPPGRAGDGPVIRLRDVGITVGGSVILDGVDLEVAPRDHLAVLGPNGSGKTTLLRVLSTYRYPTRGVARVLGTTFGRGDLRELRPRIGFVSTALDELLHVRAEVLPLVAVARRGGTWPPPGMLDDAELAATAERALARVGIAHLATRRVDTLSQGERQRVRIARALVIDPALVLLDEPFAGLDLGGRESLLADLDGLLAEPDGPTVVLVTHHLEELPTGIRRALLLRAGRVVADGAAGDVLADGPVSEAFGLPVIVREQDGRWSATVKRESTNPTTVRLVRWDGSWQQDDAFADLKADVAAYAPLDPLATLRRLSDDSGLPLGALVHYVLARWASGGSEGLLELGVSGVDHLERLIHDAEAADADAARLDAYHAMREVVGWLRAGVDGP